MNTDKNYSMNYNKKYFLMSYRFNKDTPADFGLCETSDIDMFVMKEDGSFWKKQEELYEFPWGIEKGYERLPQLTFEALFNLILYSEINENRYAAAAIILKRHPDELLNKCFEILDSKNDIKKYIELFRILKLDKPYNRSQIAGKSYQEIENSYGRWLKLSRDISKILRV